MNKFIKCLNKTPWLAWMTGVRVSKKAKEVISAALFGVVIGIIGVVILIIWIIIAEFIGFWFLFFTIALILACFNIDWSHFDKCGDNEDEL